MSKPGSSVTMAGKKKALSLSDALFASNSKTSRTKNPNLVILTTQNQAKTKTSFEAYLKSQIANLSNTKDIPQAKLQKKDVAQALPVIAYAVLPSNSNYQPEPKMEPAAAHNINEKTAPKAKNANAEIILDRQPNIIDKKTSSQAVVPSPAKNSRPIADSKTPNGVAKSVEKQAAVTSVPNHQYSQTIQAGQLDQKRPADLKAAPAKSDTQPIENRSDAVTTVAPKPVKANSELISSPVKPKTDTYAAISKLASHEEAKIESRHGEALQQFTIDQGIKNQEKTAPTLKTEQPVTNENAAVLDQLEPQISTAASNPGQKITVNLNPPDLGRVKIEFQRDGDQITGVIQVERPQVLEQIENSLAKVVQNLNENGCMVKSVEVIGTETGSLANSTNTPDYRSWDGNRQSDTHNPQFDSAYNSHSDNSFNSLLVSPQEHQQSISEKSVNLLL